MELVRGNKEEHKYDAMMCAFPFIFCLCIIRLAYVSFTVMYSHYTVFIEVLHFYALYSLSRLSEVDSGLRYKKRRFSFTVPCS